MRDLKFAFYSVLKNEDADPYSGDNLMIVADGLGGAGSIVHSIDRDKHHDLYESIMASAFGDCPDIAAKLGDDYFKKLIAPMIDDKNDTSALWASRIVMARCAYAIIANDQYEELDKENVRKHLAGFIQKGLESVKDKFKLEKGTYFGQKILPTTLAFVRYKEDKDQVVAETLWAGDSRCYALTIDGLKILSIDDEDSSGSITNCFHADNKEVRLNYRRYTIKKPCALFVASDGIFDPFEEDYLYVEHVLLKKISESETIGEVGEKLCKFYGEVHGDDATMAFTSFEFESFDKMKEKFDARNREIDKLAAESSEKREEIELINNNGQDVTDYITKRTGDKYEQIVSLIADRIAQCEQDTDAVIAAISKKLSIKKFDITILDQLVKDKMNKRTMGNIFKNDFTFPVEGTKKKKTKENDAYENMRKHFELRSQVMDALNTPPKDKCPSQNEECDVKTILKNTVVPYLKKVKRNVDTLLDYLCANKKSKPSFDKDWENLKKWLQQNPEQIGAMFSDDLVGEYQTKMRLSAVRAFDKNACSVIVEALKKSDSSVIDVLYNSTKLEKFRTYYKIKDNEIKREEIRKFQVDLDELRDSHYRLVKNENTGN